MHASLDNHSLNWTSRELLRADAKLTDTALARQHGSSGGIILHQWEFLRARLDEGEGLPWIAMDLVVYCVAYF